MVLKNKKVLKLVVCMSLILALAISALTLSVNATYENTHYNSGNQAQDIVSVAQTQVGYYEGYDGYTKYGDWYGLPNSDWCAMFVSWCADQAGVDQSTFQKFALCSAGADYFISQGNFHYSGSYTPQAGDLIFYASYGNIYHVGLVTGSDGYNVYSIEGNYNECVSNVSYSLGYGDIFGYATPSYTTDGSPAPIDTDTSVIYDTDSDEYTDSDEFVTDTDDTDEYFEYESDSDTETDSDEYTNSAYDSDSDSDSDEYTDTETETDTESSTDTMLESDTDSETDTETEFDTDSDTETDSEEPVLLGDVDGDGIVSLSDAILTQRHLVFMSELDDTQFASADADGSGEVDLNDVIRIMEISAGIYNL